MTDVLLINLPHNYPIKAPPLGLAYIAAVLEKHNHNVKILDLAVKEHNLKDEIESISSIKHVIIGLTCTVTTVKNCLKIADEVKKTSKIHS
ncbi:MAG: hypothetical protein DRJ26_05530 [Candidatus Methanomethylicota archaeon]|uniref:B12-binding domain-containing protein n=1 Tax=Thermoproteota archaeon TaxID=2056631 RepID=A0A497EWB1_9CREN|nr:MAG: hypothetical protein DRJ26_05530 [Candidatus Verstraetearchaeota archaeon]